MQDHARLSQLASSEPETFWLNLAKDYQWSKIPTVGCQGSFEQGNITWFEDGKLNISENALDRHLPRLADKMAIEFIPNNPKDPSRSLTYQELFEHVNIWANYLRSIGAKENDIVIIYMPHIPELVMATLACARLGLVHSIVFGGFSAEALKSRTEDAKSKIIITCDGGHRGDKFIPYKEIVDQSLQGSTTVEKVLVWEHVGLDNLPWNEKRDINLSDELVLDERQPFVSPVIRKSEDPLFILYTSGSTGKPKGLLHTTAGYMLWASWTMREVFQIKSDSIFWCTADAGWITGHSYVIYGPLINGVTTVMYEGIPTYPDAHRFWKIIDDHKITHFYTAPTAIRGLEAFGTDIPASHQLSSLKVCGSVGEPINLEAWEWMKSWVAKDKAPIVDTWWQTETGGILISNIAGITPEVPTKATLPLPGVFPVLLDEQGRPAKEEGILCLQQAWPGMARTIFGDHERYMETYFRPFPGYYFTGDGAQKSMSGDYRIMGRIDDVINVSGHRIGTAEVENIINESPSIIESAVIGAPHPIKGECLWAFAVAADPTSVSLGEDKSETIKLVNQLLTQKIGAIAKIDKLFFVQQLPKTRSGKIMRRFLRKMAQGEKDLGKLGDTSTLTNPEVVEAIQKLIF
jgi:acetyl-CoA synthetase